MKLIPSNKFDPATLEDMRCRLPEYMTARGVELRKQGSRLVAKCPVHADSSPSFAVFGSKLETCGCFPCGFTGDVFAAAQWMGRASSFPEAVREVAATLGVYLPQEGTQAATRPTTPPQRAAKPPEPPFMLTDAERAMVHAARLRFTDALHAGDPVIDEICKLLGLHRETLRHAAWGSSGLGLLCGSTPWRQLKNRSGHEVRLAYLYPEGMKVRNPADVKPRFVWAVGKALAPWRMEWVRPETKTVYLTEGESDCMALVEAGLEADGTACCVASPGTSFPAAWAPIFKRKKVILCFDADPPGQAAAVSVGRMLAPYATSVSNWKGTQP